MKNLINLWVAIMLMTFLSLSTIVHARTGSTSSSSSSSKSSSSSRSTTSSSSSSSSRFLSKPSKTNSSTDSAFSNAAKSNQARAAWQERNKPAITPPPINQPYPSSVPRPEDSSQAQLAAIQRQIAEAKRQQQLIAAAQTAAQIALANRARAVTTPSITVPTTTAATAIATQPVLNAPMVDDSYSNDDEGTSWFTLLLVIGGMVWFIFWLKKRATPTTIYRL